MADDRQQLEALDQQGNGLRVVFEKHGDRWRHTIERVQHGLGTVALASLEGDAADDWPPSPPFQELSRETLPDGRTVLFLVGRAGTSHWSASIEAEHAPPALVFDIACRHTQRPQQLGSAYSKLAKDVALEALLGHCTAWSMVPEMIAQQLPGTTRWKYRVM